ncbi:hypothetical protein C8R43DRAFT_1135145 [Mycena crocata]|nr:hypothetical protein C8R43DRAFT_1135145 [Mycena crocata]
MSAPATKRKHRAATSTVKAKNAAAVAAAESTEDEADDKPKRPRGRPPKKKEPVLEVSDGEDDDGKDIYMDCSAAHGSGSDTARWPTNGGSYWELRTRRKLPTDYRVSGDMHRVAWTHTLTWTLITGMEENEAIRTGLFRSPGSVQRSGALPKKHFLAQICFANNPLYAEAFAKAVTGKPKDQKFWWTKIKNRIKVLTEKARPSIAEMGETGAGLESTDEIIAGTPLHMKWDEILQDKPWFWHMRSLIGECPNLRPVGIGNNSDEMDTSLLMPQTSDDDPIDVASSDETEDFPQRLADLATDTDHGLRNQDGDDSDDDTPKVIPPQAVKPTKCKRTDSSDKPNAGVCKPATKKTKPQPAVSAPAPAKPMKLKTTKDKFSAVEKNTARKEIALAKIRAGAQVAVEKMKGKQQERILKLEIARLKLSTSFVWPNCHNHHTPQTPSLVTSLPAAYLGACTLPLGRLVQLGTLDWSIC